jgi:ABC-type dipeptide/oligopeptide/nickel transport system permease component
MAIVMSDPNPAFLDRTRPAMDFLAFLPPFVPGFVLVAVLAIADAPLAGDGPLTILVLAACVALAPACLATSIIRAAITEEREKKYVLVMRALGHDETTIARSIRRAVLIPTLGALEKIFGTLITLAIFSEFIFSYPGLGNLLINSARRSDINVLLLSGVLLSASIAALRIISITSDAVINPRSRQK